MDLAATLCSERQRVWLCAKEAKAINMTFCKHQWLLCPSARTSGRCARRFTCAHVCTHSNTMIQEIQSYGKIKSPAGDSCDSGIGQQSFNVHIQIRRQPEESADGGRQKLDKAYQGGLFFSPCPSTYQELSWCIVNHSLTPL